jgi:hypothetical protein
MRHGSTRAAALSGSEISSLSVRVSTMSELWGQARTSGVLGGANESRHREQHEGSCTVTPAIMAIANGCSVWSPEPLIAAPSGGRARNHRACS